MNEQDYAQLRQYDSALEVQQAAVIKRLEAKIDALEAAMDSAIRIFDRDDGAGQSAWNMRAVLLQARKAVKP